MTPKMAIGLAKRYVADIFGEEGAYNVGLEEVRFVPSSSMWEVTIGFSRPWDASTGSALLPQAPRRTYKVVEIDDEKRAVLAVRNRVSESQQNS